MKKTFLSLALIAIISYSFGQNNKPSAVDTPHIERPEVNSDVQAFTIVQQMPKADYDVNQYLSKNIVYPKYEKSKGITGTVFVQFIVEKDGTISNVRVLKGVENGPGLGTEAIRVVSSMSKWNPGIQNGKAVRVVYNIPIRFSLQ